MNIYTLDTIPTIRDLSQKVSGRFLFFLAENRRPNKKKPTFWVYKKGEAKHNIHQQQVNRCLAGYLYYHLAISYTPRMSATNKKAKRQRSETSTPAPRSRAKSARLGNQSVDVSSTPNYHPNRYFIIDCHFFFVGISFNCHCGRLKCLCLL